MNIEEAAQVLGVSTKTLRNYIKRGFIEAKLVDGKTGKEWNIEPSSVEAFKKNKESGLIYPAVEGVEESGKPAKAMARVEKRGTMELPGVQALPISLGPPRSSENTGRYLESIPDVLSADEVATFLGVSVATVRDYLREGKLKGLKLGRGWKISKSSLERFVKGLLG